MTTDASETSAPSKPVNSAALAELLAKALEAYTGADGIKPRKSGQMWDESMIQIEVGGKLIDVRISVENLSR